MTFSGILEAMKQRYFELNGRTVCESSETGVRFRVVANALMELEKEIKTNQRKWSLLEAEGEALSSIGEVLGLKREGHKAKGKLRIFRKLQSENEIVVNEGLFVQLGGEKEIKFKTLEKCVILTQAQFGEVLAQAEICSKDHNLKSGQNLDFCEPQEDLICVVTATKFEGGYDLEEDELFRERILRKLRDSLPQAEARRE